MGEPQEETPTTGFWGKLFKGANKPSDQSDFDLSSFNSAAAQQIQLAAYEGQSHPDQATRERYAKKYTELTGQPLPEVPPLETTAVYIPEETHITAAAKAAVLARGRTRPPTLRSTGTHHGNPVVSPEGK